MFCGMCGSRIDEGNNFCVNCGAKVSAAPLTNEPLKKHCAACGTVLNAGAAFCPNCGQAAGADSANNAPVQPLIQMNSLSQPAANSAPPQSDWHGFVTAWLILGIIFSSLSGLIIIGCAAAGIYYPNTEYFLVNGFLVLLGLGCYIALLRRKKQGFSFLIGISLVQTLSSFINFGMITGLVSLAGSAVGLLILWAIMQLRKNGKSAWDMLK